ncbi:hypothetical protein RchiOBHm_Chr5g0007641 [Rosa chinensis]|uniref:Uncharacterized protein n=1 Tax=Rosa chinensis TaxID=74649 RepID=A0A2P6Q3V2_ROSCH|nr:hypothetical protein RchiOBHm_Chr5g0007641 [Rosa chinensis]
MNGFEFSRTLSREQFAQLLMLIWAIWKNRNSKLWESACQHLSEVVLLTMRWFKEFTKANNSALTQKRGVERWSDWSPLELSWVKYNGDAAFILRILEEELVVLWLALVLVPL